MPAAAAAAAMATEQPKRYTGRSAIENLRASLSLRVVKTEPRGCAFDRRKNGDRQFIRTDIHDTQESPPWAARLTTVNKKVTEATAFAFDKNNKRA